MNNNIETLVKELKQSPTYAMSLGSKELFHSNFWAWLFENEGTILQGNYIDIFFPPEESNKKNNRKAIIKREEKHRDISIHLGKELYVIENKLKSHLFEDQLERYSSEDHIDKACFTGVYNPFEKESLPTKNGTEWKYIDYGTIGENIANEAEKEEEPYKTIIKSYASDITILNKIISPIFNETKNSYIIRINSSLFSDIRMDDIVLKRNASEFYSYATKSEYNLQPEITFNNKKSTITFRKILLNGASAGIQIEGNQYRRFLQINGKESTICKSLFDTAIKSKWLCKDFNPKDNKCVFNKKTSMRPRNSKYYNQYEKPNPFVYQYWDIDKEKSLKTTKAFLADTVLFDELLNYIKEDLEELTRKEKEIEKGIEDLH